MRAIKGHGQRPGTESAMLDGKAYQAHFPDDPAYDFSSIPGAPGPLKSAALMAALAALEKEFRIILREAAASTE
jgi:hypothetical protein